MTITILPTGEFELASGPGALPGISWSSSSGCGSVVDLGGQSRQARLRWGGETIASLWERAIQYLYSTKEMKHED